MIKLAILASGSGTNAENLAKYFANHTQVEIPLILSNNPQAFVLNRAKKFSITSQVFNRAQMMDGTLSNILSTHQIDYLVLAGFLWLIPEHLIQQFKNRIINIHPALLPKYGGKGMYGDRVHKEVILNQEIESGITIHLVNEKYDDGEILFQGKCSVDSGDNHESLAQKIHELEYDNYPSVIEDYILKMNSSNPE